MCVFKDICMCKHTSGLEGVGEPFLATTVGRESLEDIIGAKEGGGTEGAGAGRGSGAFGRELGRAAAAAAGTDFVASVTCKTKHVHIKLKTYM